MENKKFFIAFSSHSVSDRKKIRLPTPIHPFVHAHTHTLTGNNILNLCTKPDMISTSLTTSHLLNAGLVSEDIMCITVYSISTHNYQGQKDRNYFRKVHFNFFIIIIYGDLLENSNCPFHPFVRLNIPNS